MKVIMVYPRHGFSGNFVKHAPLSLLYASVGLVKNNIEVEILDIRLVPNSWEKKLKEMLTPDVSIVGISVMSGKPILNAVEIGRLVKSISPEISVVWGGPHATFYPESILEQEWSCDYVISGYASETFYQLVHCIQNKIEPSEVPGTSYRKGTEIVHMPPVQKFEFINYKEIPYHLIPDYRVYGQLDQERIIFSIYSAMGCVYKCTFCSSPAQYADFGKRWVPFEIKDVVDHIEYVIDQYNANYIYFIDDDSFINLKHVEGIIDEINRRNIKIGLGFRGARVNEIKRMSDKFLDKLIQAGTNIIHVGAESGSDRILKLIRKDCTVKDIIAINKKLAHHQGLLIAYNFILGLPTETLGEVKSTRDLMLRLVEDNPRCIIFPPNKYRPLPGTELFELARKEWGYSPPTNLNDWANVETEGDFSAPWYPEGMKGFCDLLLIGSYFIDNQIQKVTSGNTLFYKILRVFSTIYGPIARFRLRHGIYQFLVEFYAYQIITKWMGGGTATARK